MNHGVRKSWILHLLDYLELFGISLISLDCFGNWNVANFSSAVPRIPIIPARFGLISFKGGRKLVDIYGTFQIFYPSQATQANSETKDELFNPS